MEYMFNMKNIEEFKEVLKKNGHTSGKIYKCPSCSELMFSLGVPQVCSYCGFAMLQAGVNNAVFDFSEPTKKTEVVSSVAPVSVEEAEEFVDVLEDPYAPREAVEAAMEKLLAPKEEPKKFVRKGKV